VAPRRKNTFYVFSWEAVEDPQDGDLNRGARIDPGNGE